MGEGLAERPRFSSTTMSVTRCPPLRVFPLPYLIPSISTEVDDPHRHLSRLWSPTPPILNSYHRKSLRSFRGKCNK